MKAVFAAPRKTAAAARKAAPQRDLRKKS